MPEKAPPSIDPAAAARWHALASEPSPWLHEEVARRMQERLSWIVRPPDNWCHWDPVRGGLQAHATVAAGLPRAPQWIHETSSAAARAVARRALEPAWWSAARWLGPRQHFAEPAPASMQMVWANMALHMSAQPQALVAQWHQALAPDGFLMFSCLGPDTVQELRALYARLGWPQPGHSFTDMHDWGDMLAAAGFAEPVMDMERIILTFASPERLLQELRGLGRNLHPERFAALRGRRWKRELERAIAEHLPDAKNEGRLALTFEIIYGHAFKPAARAPREQRSWTKTKAEYLAQMGANPLVKQHPDA
ncbi:class I SAM-dependent methyltransferase [Comamonas sp. NLF-1-9]|uniref:class I SAM-dependent methyltransferase n=1 Tax=Comamonas sp. NLF-1-9 TaxID=2853163 RepID=UPI001C437990|nr:class I SAM-dependent methyltransferase [Comamonas sp. NLF-1-9]QXL84734.1 class I SAM-dependent methyltransferase [Comamonas sp. NLF-1-9]